MAESHDDDSLAVHARLGVPGRGNAAPEYLEQRAGKHQFSPLTSSRFDSRLPIRLKGASQRIACAGSRFREEIWVDLSQMPAQAQDLQTCLETMIGALCS